MVDHDVVRVAMRAKVLAVIVCSTGVVALSATAEGYARVAGSFVTDGFRAGMEVTPAGFGTNTVGVVTRVTDLELTVDGGRVPEAAAGGRSLTVGLPGVRALPNSPVVDGNVPTPDGEVIPGRPYFEEQYLPGPAALNSIGPAGRLVAEPQYLPRVFVPEGSGDEGATKYAQAILNLFPPSDVIALADGNSIHVRADVAPVPGQLLPDGKSHAGILCTIPVRCYAINSI